MCKQLNYVMAYKDRCTRVKAKWEREGEDPWHESIPEFNSPYSHYRVPFLTYMYNVPYMYMYMHLEYHLWKPKRHPKAPPMCPTVLPYMRWLHQAHSVYIAKFCITLILTCM